MIEREGELARLEDGFVAAGVGDGAFVVVEAPGPAANEWAPDAAPHHDAATAPVPPSPAFRRSTV